MAPLRALLTPTPNFKLGKNLSRAPHSPAQPSPARRGDDEGIVSCRGVAPPSCNMEQEKQQLTPYSCLCLLSRCGEEIGATLCHSVPGRTLHSFSSSWCPLASLGLGLLHLEQTVAHHTDTGLGIIIEILPRLYPGRVSELRVYPTTPSQPISISTSSRRSSSILAATGELIKNRNSWMNRIHETNKIRKDDHILDDGLVIFFQ